MTGVCQRSAATRRLVDYMAVARRVIRDVSRRRKPQLTYSGWRPEGETVRCGAACVRRSPLETSSGQIGSSVCCGAACVRRSLLETPSGKIGSYLNCTYIKNNKTIGAGGL